MLYELRTRKNVQRKQKNRNKQRKRIIKTNGKDKMKEEGMKTVRINEETHRKIKGKASMEGKSLKNKLEEIFEKALQ